MTIQSHSGASKHFATFGIVSGNRKVWSVSDSLLGGGCQKAGEFGQAWGIDEKILYAQGSRAGLVLCDVTEKHKLMGM